MESIEHIFQIGKRKRLKIHEQYDPILFNDIVEEILFNSKRK